MRTILFIFIVGALCLPNKLIAQKSIYETDEAIIFFGKNDVLWSPDLWNQYLKTWAKDLCTVSYKAREIEQAYELTGRHNWLPGESTTGFDRGLITPGSDLFALVATNLLPFRERSNIFAKASEPYEDALTRRIASHPPNSLLPADVMSLALEITKGDYRYACLTVHSVLKTITNLGREIVHTSEISRNNYITYISQDNYDPIRKAKSTKFMYTEYEKDFNEALEMFKFLNQVVLPLKNLRADPDATPDKMGPWYHIFALFTIDALSSGQSMIAFYAEHWGKYLKTFNNEGGYNKEKETIDYAFISSQGNCSD